MTLAQTRDRAYLGRPIPNTRCLAFFGVPYALPPTAHRRFRRPEPIPPDAATLTTAHHPVFALQAATGPNDVGGAGSEDCLYLDIYTPADFTPNAALPVLVYIHGGAYKFGAPKNWPFHHWVDAHPNILVVSVYYRLTVLGFLAHPDLPTSGLADLNVGIHDQILALRWINQNIAAFGGDPSKVTVCGQSAGASSVEIQLTAFNGTQRLFRGAIAQSVYRTPVAKPEEKTPVFHELLKELECPAPAGDLAAQVAWLRSVNAVELVQAADRVSKRFPSTLGSWRPVVDGDILHDYPTVLIQEGKFADVPVLIGATTHETADVTENSPWSDLTYHWPGLQGSGVIDRAREMYDGDILQAAGDAMFRSATLSFAEHFAKSWVYRFDQPAGQDSRVRHSADNWWMFNGARTGPNASVTFDGIPSEHQAFSDQLISQWVSFVREQDPGWPPYQKTDSKRMVLRTSPTPTEVESFTEEEKAKLRFWIEHARGLQS